MKNNLRRILCKNIICYICISLLPNFVWAQKVSVAKFLNNRQAAVSLTFDDGIQEHYTLVAPHLDNYGLKGTFGINGVYMGDLDDQFAPRMTWEECRQLVRNGHEISNHSWSHLNLLDVDSLTLLKEVCMNDSIIEAETGVRPISFLYPFNAFVSKMQYVCEKGKVGSRIQQFALGQRNSGCTSSSINAWLRYVVDNGLWGVTMTHGIYTAWDQWNEPWVLWNFFRDLSFKKDSIWVDTFANIQSYVKERDAMELVTSIDNDTLLITPTLQLDSTIFRMPITLNISKQEYKANVCAMQDGKKLQVVSRGKYYMVNINPYGGTVKVFQMYKDFLKGKKICFIGDSYVYNHGCHFSETWHYKCAAKNGMKYLNFGINGNSIAFERDSLYGEPLYKRYKKIPKDVDYIIFIAGHNDAYLVNKDKTKQDVLRKRMDSLLKNTKASYPKAKIGWLMPWNVAYEGFPITISIINEVCKENNINVLDAAYSSMINPNDSVFRMHYFQGKNDNAHLNNAGHDLFLDMGEQFIVGL